MRLGRRDGSRGDEKNQWGVDCERERTRDAAGRREVERGAHTDRMPSGEGGRGRAGAARKREAR